MRLLAQLGNVSLTSDQSVQLTSIVSHLLLHEPQFKLRRVLRPLETLPPLLPTPIAKVASLRSKPRSLVPEFVLRYCLTASYVPISTAAA